MLSGNEFKVLQFILKDKKWKVKYTKTNKNIYQYLTNKSFYQSKLDRIQEWLHNKDIYGEITELIIDIITTELVIGIITIVLEHTEIAYSALVGMLANKVSLEDPVDRAKILADLIGIMVLTDMLDLEGEYGTTAMLVTRIKLTLEPEDKHVIFSEIEEITDNKSDYGHVILGGKIKQHDRFVSLDVINKQNSILLSLNVKLLGKIAHKPSKPLETEEMKEQWKLFARECTNKYLEAVHTKRNQFSIVHKYDTRGRMYADSYYINYQGTAYQKAVIQLANKEIVR